MSLVRGILCVWLVLGWFWVGLGVPRGFPLLWRLCNESPLFFGSLRSHSSDFGDNAIMKPIPSLLVLCASWCDMKMTRAACFVPVALALGAPSVASAQADQSGLVRAWGYNYYGQCNIPSDLGFCTQIAGGEIHTIAIQQSGIVRAWGNNDYGQCNIPSDLGVCTQIAGGGNHTIAIQNSGIVRAWGRNSEGQCNIPSDLGVCTQIAGGGSHTIAIQIIDCDANGIPDATEMAGNDCNGNGIHDACEITAGLLEDCNDNGLADTCEKSQVLDFTSTQMGPIGAGSPKLWTIPNVAHASTDVQLRVLARGDFDSPFETLTVKIDTVYTQVLLGNTGSGTQCNVREGVVTVPMNLFNGGILPNGSVILRFEGSIAVDPNACPQGSWVEATLEYITSTSADCNANGLLDTCEIAAGLGADVNRNGQLDECEDPIIACPGDFNLDHLVNGADMGMLLAAWGPNAPPAIDLNADGSVGGADLAILLGAWGPCQEN